MAISETAAGNACSLGRDTTTLGPWILPARWICAVILEVAVFLFSLPRIYEVSVETACKSSLTPSRALVTTKFLQKGTGRRAPKKKLLEFHFQLSPSHPYSLSVGLLFPSFSFLVDFVAG